MPTKIWMILILITQLKSKLILLSAQAQLYRFNLPKSNWDFGTKRRIKNIYQRHLLGISHWKTCSL